VTGGISGLTDHLETNIVIHLTLYVVHQTSPGGGVISESKLDLIIERPDKSVLDKVVVAVREAISTGALAPGRRLTERELMELTGVSRTSIREAVRRLQSLGLMETTPTRGVRVSILGAAEVQHIYEVRDALEPAAAELFVKRATDAEVEELAILGVMPEDDRAVRLAAIARFDEMLLAGCGNPILQGILEPLHARIHALRGLSLTIPGRQAASTQEYVELVEAIRARSPERAAAASHRHIRAAAESALAAIRQLEGQA
jgi:GntR family transcriptional regulator, trigonelline degradation regulator